LDSHLHDSIKSPRLIYSFFLLLIVIWCSLILVAPLLAKFEHRFSSGLIYFFFSKICHQIPERSFFLFGKQLAVCSRCAGLYFGFLIGAILYLFIYKLKRVTIPSPKYLLIACIPIGIDVFIRTFHIAENTFATRSITGLILGVTSLFFVIPGILSIKSKLNSTKIEDYDQAHLSYRRMITRISYFVLIQGIQFLMGKNPRND
jgi:uncharacterized membrane protein